MKKYLNAVGILFLSAVLFACGSDSDEPLPPANPDLDLTGTWNVVEKTGANTCQYPINEVWDSYTLDVVQTGAMVLSSRVGTTPVEVSSFTLSGNNLIANSLDSYAEGSGTVTETAISLNVDTSGLIINGVISITYSEAGTSPCNGSINLVASKSIVQ